MNIAFPNPISNIMPEIKEKALTSFYGGPGTGKTCLCLLAAIECAKNNGKVVYLDTEGGFSRERLEQLLTDKMSLTSFLKKIKLMQPKTFDGQGEIIKSLKDKDMDFIIVDSLVALYRLEYSNQEEILAASRKLSKQLALLSEIAREKSIPVLLTAHTYKKWATGENEMIGGEVLKYWSKAIIFLERTGRMSERVARLVKHQFIAEGKETKFMMTQNGIGPVKFKLF